MKSLLSAFLVVIMIGSFALAGTLHFGTAHAATDVTGIISSDTTWAKADSPYSLSGSVAVDKGVTLTVEPGVTVNLNNYYIQVNGTLVARGTSTVQIYINNGSITFTQLSASWNEQTGSGCIIENAILALNEAMEINNASPKIDQSSVNATIVIDEGSPLILNNTIVGQGNGGAIIINGGSPVISNNIITSRPEGFDPFYNIVYRSYPHVYYGISFEGNSSAYISDNTIYGFAEGGIGMFPGEGINTQETPTIQRNYITRNSDGIDIELQATIQNNTISGNSVGIRNPSPSSTIVYNNIQNNTQNSIYLSTSSDINATYNWWGTTDVHTINASIYDFKNDFNLGKVNFVPILTSPNPEATPNPNLSPIPTPEIPEFPFLIILLLIITASAFLIVFKRNVKRK
jgi:hypothetical protein